MVLHTSRLAHGMYGCEHGSVDADCCSQCNLLVCALVVCGQVDYITLCGQPESTFRDMLNVYG